MNVYYKTANLKLPPNSNFRQFKYLAEEKDGSCYMKTIRRRITSEKDLKKELAKEKNKILDLYVSIACYLRPEWIRGKKRKDAHYKIADNCFMWCDYGVDIDEKNVKTFKRIIELLLKKGFKEISGVETNSGFQIWVHDFSKSCKKIANPRERENQYFEKMVELTYWLKRHKLVFDYPQSVNTRQILRVIGSQHRKGTIITELFYTSCASDRESASSMTQAFTPEGVVFKGENYVLGSNTVRGHSEAIKATGFPRSIQARSHSLAASKKRMELVNCSFHDMMGNGSKWQLSFNLWERNLVKARL